MDLDKSPALALFAKIVLGCAQQALAGVPSTHNLEQFAVAPCLLKYAHSTCPCEASYS